MSARPTALLADDEPFMRAALRQHLQQLWPELEIVQECEDGPSALTKLEQLRPDLAFLDIRMPGLSGLQVAQAMTVSSKLVFVTAYDAHALEAFEANAVDYVLKPLELHRLARLVAKLRKALAETVRAGSEEVLRAVQAVQGRGASASAAPRTEWLQVAMGTQIRLVHVDDVMYFESDTKYTRVVSDDCDGLIRLSLKELLDHIGAGGFVQTHRSLLVNRRFIRSVHRFDDKVELELRGREERLKVSTSNHHLFRAM